MTYENYSIPTINGRPGCIGARVTAVHRERFEIVTEYGFSHAQMKRGRMYATDELPTVGDVIAVEYNPSGDSMATEVLPRSTLFARSDGWHARRQPIAANVDLACIVTSMNDEFSLRRLERYLALARESGAEPVFLLTKLDIASEQETADTLRRMRAMAPDVRTLALSARTGEGMDALKALLTPGRIAVLLGSSGVGKSSLVNALMGREAMQTGEIREDDAKGRHTTVHRQMLELPGGALLIDTPGMRELGMWDAVDGVNDVFAEIAAAADCCRFRDCTHTREPGCAVRQGVENGTLDPDRVRSYLQLSQEADRTAQMARKKEKMKQISQANRKRRKQTP